MKMAVFSDIHGNMHFFEAFLRDAEAEGVDRLIFLGDAVSYYPFGCAVIRSLRELGALCIEELLHRRCIEQVEFLVGPANQVGVAAGEEVGPDGGAHEAPVPCYIDLGFLVKCHIGQTSFLSTVDRRY